MSKLALKLKYCENCGLKIDKSAEKFDIQLVKSNKILDLCEECNEIM